MKKLFVLIFLLLFTLALVSCDKPTTTTTETPYTIEEMKVTAITLTGYLLKSPNIFNTAIYTAEAVPGSPVYAVGDMLYVRMYEDELVVEIITIQDITTITTVTTTGG